MDKEKIDQIEIIHRKIVTIKTITNKDEVKEVVKKCLQDLDLRANIL